MFHPVEVAVCMHTPVLQVGQPKCSLFISYHLHWANELKHVNLVMGGLQSAPVRLCTNFAVPYQHSSDDGIGAFPLNSKLHSYQNTIYTMSLNAKIMGSATDCTVLLFWFSLPKWWTSAKINLMWILLALLTITGNWGMCQNSSLANLILLLTIDPDVPTVS